MKMEISYFYDKSDEENPTRVFKLRIPDKELDGISLRDAEAGTLLSFEGGRDLVSVTLFRLAVAAAKIEHRAEFNRLRNASEAALRASEQRAEARGAAEAEIERNNARNRTQRNENATGS